MKTEAEQMTQLVADVMEREGITGTVTKVPHNPDKPDHKPDTMHLYITFTRDDGSASTSYYMSLPGEIGPMKTRVPTPVEVFESLVFSATLAEWIVDRREQTRRDNRTLMRLVSSQSHALLTLRMHMHTEGI